MELKKTILPFLLSLVVFAWLSGCDDSRNAWRIAERTNTVEAYEEFLSAHPGSRFAEAAQERMNTLETIELMLGPWEFKGFYVPPGTGFVTSDFTLGPFGGERMIHYPETVDFREDGSVIAAGHVGTYSGKTISLGELGGRRDYSSLEIVSVTNEELVLKNPSEANRAYYERQDAERDK